jgi:hypothetical protein
VRTTEANDYHYRVCRHARSISAHGSVGRNLLNRRERRHLGGTLSRRSVSWQPEVNTGSIINHTSLLPGFTSAYSSSTRWRMIMFSKQLIAKNTVDKIKVTGHSWTVPADSPPSHNVFLGCYVRGSSLSPQILLAPSPSSNPTLNKNLSPSPMLLTNVHKDPDPRRHQTYLAQKTTSTPLP